MKENHKSPILENFSLITLYTIWRLTIKETGMTDFPGASTQISYAFISKLTMDI